MVWSQTLNLPALHSPHEATQGVTNCQHER